MKVTITDIQGDNELKQLLQTIKTHDGKIEDQQTAEVGTMVKVEFENYENAADFDVEVCDLGFEVVWDWTRGGR